ncbi:MAG: hypothetical protein MK172_13805, partial [Verrucomicrobiales bacterium]|nr:hypothetical protein [Verrucomicrobiales bacterium]
RKIFPKGKEDLIAFSNYLQESNMKLTLRTTSYAIGQEHPVYAAEGNIDPRLASWWEGTLAESINATATEITVAEGKETPTNYDPNRGQENLFNRRCMQIGNELIIFETYSDNGDGTWTLKGCKRGHGRTIPKTHDAGVQARGLYRIYGTAFAPDPDSTLLTEIAKRFADFHNEISSGNVNFDALEVHEMKTYYGDTKFAGEVYRHIDHPVFADTSGAYLTWGYYEPLFESVRSLGKKTDVPAPEGIPYAHDFKIGLHKSHRSASSPYAYVWSIPSNATAGREIDVTAQVGFHDVTMEMVQNHGLIDHYINVFKQWDLHGPNLPAHIKKRIYASWIPRKRYSLIDEVFRFEGEGKNLSVVPFRVMKREGIDSSWTYFQEHGTLYPYQYIRPGETLTLNNPYAAQIPEFIIRVMPDFRRDSVSMHSTAKVETAEEKTFYDMLDKFQGASGVVLEDNTSISKFGDEVNYPIMPDPSKIKNAEYASFNTEGNAVRIIAENPSDEPFELVKVRGDLLPFYEVQTDITNAGGLGVLVTGDGSGAILVIRISGQGTRDYLVHLNFTGKRYIEIPSPQVSWADARWTFKSDFKRWRSNHISRVSLGIDRVPAGKRSSILIEDLRFLPETKSSLVYPTINVGSGSISIQGTVPSDRYLWYQGGDSVGVYDLNWNKLESLPVHLNRALFPSSEASVSVKNNNPNGDPWLEVQFYVKDTPLPVGAL